MLTLARYTRLCLAAAAAAAACVLCPGAALAAPGIGGFSVRPVETDPSNPATRAYFVQRLARGVYVRDEVLVSNLSSRPVRLRIYPVDGVTGATSGAVYTNRGEKLRGTARWLRADIGSLALAPHAHTLVPFVAWAPRTAQAGDHLAGIAVENMSRARSHGRFSVTEIVREVVGVEIEVPGRAAPQLALRGLSLAALPGTQIPSVIVKLGDSGLKLCKPHLTVTLNGQGGVGTVDRSLDTILPGDYIPYPFPWPRALRGGLYRASATASGCGHTVRENDLVRLGAPLSGTSAHPGYGTQAARAGGEIALWLIAVVALAGVAAGVGVTLRVSRGRSRGLSTST